MPKKSKNEKNEIPEPEVVAPEIESEVEPEVEPEAEVVAPEKTTEVVADVVLNNLVHNGKKYKKGDKVKKTDEYYPFLKEHGFIN